jgi:NADPH:quinone reductase-like Zn-dependent oxidoreductase
LGTEKIDSGGSYASQIAKNLGARVIGTAAQADIEYLRSLGVDEVIDYHRERFEDKATGVVKRGGVLATTVQPIDESAAKRGGSELSK